MTGPSSEEFRGDIHNENGRPIEDDEYDSLGAALLWSAFNFFVLPRLPDSFRFLAVCGGSGRLTDRIAIQHTESTGLLYSPVSEALAHAESRAHQHGYADRVRLKQGDVMEAASVLSGQRFDLIFHTQHLLGRVEDPVAVLRSLATLLSERGLLVFCVASRWHAAATRLRMGEVDAAELGLAGHGGTPCDGTPVQLFTPGEIRSLTSAAGLWTDLIAGFPGLVHPDTHGSHGDGSMATTEALLRHNALFKQVLRMERELLIDPDAVGRGANLFVVTSSPSHD